MFEKAKGKRNKCSFLRLFFSMDTFNCMIESELGFDDFFVI